MRNNLNLQYISSDSDLESTSHSELEEEGFLLKEIPVGVNLVHGSTESEFLDRLRYPLEKDFPDGPAFFAYHSEFSTHVALQVMDQHRDREEEVENIFLHSYSVEAPIKVLEFDSFKDVEDCILDLGGSSYGLLNKTQFSAMVFAFFPNIDGFRVLEDSLRSEPEVILNERGLSKISRQFKIQLEVKEEQARTLDDMDVPLQYRLGGEMGRAHNAQVGSVLETFQESPETSRGRLTRTRSANLEEVLRRDSEKKTPRQGRRR